MQHYQLQNRGQTTIFRKPGSDHHFRGFFGASYADHPKKAQTPGADASFWRTDYAKPPTKPGSDPVSAKGWSVRDISCASEPGSDPGFREKVVCPRFVGSSQKGIGSNDGSFFGAQMIRKRRRGLTPVLAKWWSDPGFSGDQGAGPNVTQQVLDWAIQVRRNAIAKLELAKYT
jgi:hypothetical protein